MREIKFRAKDKVNNKWIYGNLETPLLDWNISKRYIVGYSYGQYQKHEVEPETVGQCTGLKDKNGVGICEGDIDKDGYIVTYVDGSDESDIGMNVGFYIQRNDFESWIHLEVGAMYEIIGNIHDNPELIEVNQ